MLGINTDQKPDEPKVAEVKETESQTKERKFREKQNILQSLKSQQQNTATVTTKIEHQDTKEYWLQTLNDLLLQLDEMRNVYSKFSEYKCTTAIKHPGEPSIWDRKKRLQIITNRLSILTNNKHLLPTQGNALIGEVNEHISAMINGLKDLINETISCLNEIELCEEDQAKVMFYAKCYFDDTILIKSIPPVLNKFLSARSEIKQSSTDRLKSIAKPNRLTPDDFIAVYGIDHKEQKKPVVKKVNPIPYDERYPAYGINPVFQTQSKLDEKSPMFYPINPLAISENDDNEQIVTSKPRLR